MEIVGEADGRLDERKRQGVVRWRLRRAAERRRAMIETNSLGANSLGASFGPGVADSEVGDADQGAEEESESGVLLDEERNDEQDAAEKGGRLEEILRTPDARAAKRNKG